jgi:predicted ATPase
LKSEVLAEPVLVGREKELEELMHFLDSAVVGKGTTVFIAGEAGSGKTRLINEFLKAAKEKTEVTALTGLCLSNAAVPYLPFVEAFSSYFSPEESGQTENAVAEINAWLSGARQAEKSEKHDNLAPQAWKDLAFAAVTKALSIISAARPLILFIEDLHWADSASLSLLHFIARALRSEKVLLLATFRSEELMTDTEGQAHPLAEELRMMSREGLFAEIKLSNLDQTCVGEIAENMMHGNISPELAVKLSQESRGNALFVVESLRMLSERGSLYKENDEWRIAEGALGIPGKFKDVILRRLNLLKFNQRRVLDAASVIGEKFDVELLSVVLGQDSLEILEILNTVAKSTSLLSVEGSFFRFDHAKSRQAIYEEIALPLKKGYHRRVAEKLENTSIAGRLPFSEIAYHYAEAGNEEKAVKFALEAGQDALAKFSNAEALKHFDYVLKNQANSPENAVVRSLAMEGLGDAYYANGKFAKALETFELLASFEKGIVRLRAYRKAMDASSFGPGDRKYVLRLASQAEPYAACDRLEYARIRFRRSMALRPNEGGEKERSSAMAGF